MAKLWARPVHGVLILAKGGGGLGPMLDPPLTTHHVTVTVAKKEGHRSQDQTIS